MAPQPRVAPAAPQAPTPTVVPNVPALVPAPTMAQPGVQPGPTGGPAKVDKQGVPLSGIPVGLEGEVGGSLKTPGTTGGPVVPQRTAGTPLSGIPVGLEGEPGGIAAGKGKTNAQGNITLKDLKPGRYAIICCDDTVPAAQFLTVSTSVNGKPQSRADFPVGSSVGTFTVSSARDTITLAFTIGSPSTPTNGTPGFGGGR